MKASELKERNQYISIQSANIGRKNLCAYLKTLADMTIDIFWGSHTIDELDKIFLTDSDYSIAFDIACAVIAYKQLNIYGADSEIIDIELFQTISHKDCDSINTFYCNELANEYGRQLHYLIAEKAQEVIENDIGEEN
jgi:hypothetical protein